MQDELEKLIKEEQEKEIAKSKRIISIILIGIFLITGIGYFIHGFTGVYYVLLAFFGIALIVIPVILIQYQKDKALIEKVINAKNDREVLKAIAQNANEKKMQKIIKQINKILKKKKF